MTIDILEIRRRWDMEPEAIIESQCNVIIVRLNCFASCILSCAHLFTINLCVASHFWIFLLHIFLVHFEVRFGELDIWRKCVDLCINLVPIVNRNTPSWVTYKDVSYLRAPLLVITLVVIVVDFFICGWWEWKHLRLVDPSKSKLGSAISLGNHSDTNSCKIDESFFLKSWNKWQSIGVDIRCQTNYTLGLLNILGSIDCKTLDRKEFEGVEAVIWICANAHFVADSFTIICEAADYCLRYSYHSLLSSRRCGLIVNLILAVGTIRGGDNSPVCVSREPHLYLLGITSQVKVTRVEVGVLWVLKVLLNYFGICLKKSLGCRVIRSS